MTGIIDVGGGTRGIYGCGVFDRCIDDNLTFDYVLGVSAGAGNSVSYIAGQRGRNYVFYTEYAFRPEYMGAKTFLKTGSFVGLDYIYGTLCNSDGESPLDYDAVQSSPIDLEIVATDVRTGNPVYFGKQALKRDQYQCLMASSCVPMVCRPYPFNGALYYDGGISDPIPYRRALDQGCDQLVVILTKPVTMPIDSRRYEFAGAVLRHRYPNAGPVIANCKRVYQRQLEEVLQLEKEGRVLIIAPDDIGNLKTLSMDRAALIELYKKGYNDAAAIASFLN